MSLIEAARIVIRVMDDWEVTVGAIPSRKYDLVEEDEAYFAVLLALRIRNLTD